MLSHNTKLSLVIIGGRVRKDEASSLMLSTSLTMSLSNSRKSVPSGLRVNQSREDTGGEKLLIPDISGLLRQSVLQTNGR